MTHPLVLGGWGRGEFRLFYHYLEGFAVDEHGVYAGSRRYAQSVRVDAAAEERAAGYVAGGYVKAFCAGDDDGAANCVDAYCSVGYAVDCVRFVN